ncbi:MAG: class II aldolase/adducin family protein [Oscillospiraceae bacterium]|nr:class II aldolase/adducin family protein [Oscillospiraceae bacterium]
MNDKIDTLTAKQQICQIGRRLYELGYGAANDGNLSVRISNDEIWTSPTAVSKGFMTEDMLVRVDLSGNIIEGSRNPSSEIKLHLEVYSKLHGVGAVIHAHPPLATAFAVCRRPLDKNYMPEGVVALGVVPVAEYATPSTDAVPRSVTPYLNGEHCAVLLANHGALAWEETLEAALFKIQTVEYMAGIYINTDKLGGGVELPEDEVRRLRGMRGFYAAYANTKQEK